VEVPPALPDVWADRCKSTQMDWENAGRNLV
jgi:hypothetical protein